MSVKYYGTHLKKHMAAIARKSLICCKIENIAASYVRFAQNLNGQESLSESNFGLVVKTQWLPYHILCQMRGI